MKAMFQPRTWISMLMAALFVICHSTTVRPRILLVERFAAVRALSSGRPRPRMAC